MPDALEAMSSSRVWPSSGGTPRSILVVDDSPANLTVLQKVLARRGHRVDLASNGVEALDHVRSGHYDLVLMDVEMPRLDGVRAAAAIRTLDTPAASVPIVAISAHAAREDQERCLGAGMNAFLSKPMAADELLRTVERLAAGPADEAAGKERPDDDVDPNVLDLRKALERLEGDRELLCEVASIYADDAGPLLADLDAGLEASDSERAKLAAHSLKGLASNFGRACAAAAEAVEFAARDGQFDEARRLRPQLEQEVTRLIAALRAAGLTRAASDSARD
jgi:CheY-like chemotaxis protein